MNKDNVLQDLIALAMLHSPELKNENSGFSPSDFTKGELVKCPLFKCFLQIIEIDAIKDKIKVVDFRNLENGYVTLPAKCLSKVDLDPNLLEALYYEVQDNSDKSSKNENK